MLAHLKVIVLTSLNPVPCALHSVQHTHTHMHIQRILYIDIIGFQRNSPIAHCSVSLLYTLPNIRKSWIQEISLIFFVIIFLNMIMNYVYHLKRKLINTWCPRKSVF